MKETSKKTNRYKVSFILLLACVLSVSIFMSVPMAAAKDYLPPGYEYTNNYYKTYGEPDIYASVIGDTEFERGETAQIRVSLSNKGVLYGFKAVKMINNSEAEHQLAIQEMEYEKLKTTAYGIKASLVSPSELIEVDTATNSQYMQELLPGAVSENPLVFIVTISDNAPAGAYMLEIPMTYEYQSDVRMTAGESGRLGLPSLDHASYYETANRTIQIPVIVQPEAKFDVTDVSGTLVKGSESEVNVTYTNTGELPAFDAVARLIVMKPLSSTHSIRSIGYIQPGESKTVSFVISSELLAVEKAYGIDSEIKYKDVDDEDQFSKSMKVHVDLKDPDGAINVTYLAIIGLVITGIVLIIKNRKRNSSNGPDN